MPKLITKGIVTFEVHNNVRHRRVDVRKYFLKTVLQKFGIARQPQQKTLLVVQFKSFFERVDLSRYANF